MFINKIFRKFVTVCSGNREQLIREEDRTDLSTLRPGEFRLFDPACMPIMTADERENIRLAQEARELSAQK